IYDNEEHHKRMNEDSLMHAPEFVIKPRSHTVYKNNVTIDPAAHPGKYKIESSYSVHSLEISR
ncbi:hypothetical protein CRUP_011676, partial [Coryphaenoides rupestris]